MLGTKAWTFHGPFGPVDFEARPSAAEAERRDESLREVSKLGFEFAYGSAEARAIVMEIHAWLKGLPAPARLSTSPFDVGSGRAEAIIEDLKRAVLAGGLTARARTLRSVVLPVDFDEETLGPEPVKEEPTAWIAIEVVDDEGEPMAGIEYRVEAADGSVRTGLTDASGKAREEGLEPGSCKVSFPGLNGSDLSKAA